MPQAYTAMLDFFQLVFLLPGYQERPILMEPEEDGSIKVVKWEGGKDSETLEKLTEELVSVSKIE